MRGVGVPPGATRAGGVPRFKVEKHERFLTREELYRLGQVLRAAPAERLASNHAAAAIRLLVLTGCRRNEILGLRWDDLSFDTGEMRLPDSKTGARMVPLTSAGGGRAEGPPSHSRQPVGVSGQKEGPPAWSTSTIPGSASADAPTSTAFACMTSDTRLQVTWNRPALRNLISSRYITFFLSISAPRVNLIGRIV